ESKSYNVAGECINKWVNGNYKKFEPYMDFSQEDPKMQFDKVLQKFSNKNKEPLFMNCSHISDLFIAEQKKLFDEDKLEYLDIDIDKLNKDLEQTKNAEILFIRAKYYFYQNDFDK